jgi:hypothetical protein
MAIGGSFINDYWCLLLVIILLAISDYCTSGIGGYYIHGYWWLFVIILLMVINGYYIYGY